MLPEIAVSRHCCAESIDVDNYRPIVGEGLIDEVQRLSRELQGVRICQINATANGGGVAELLSRQIPIYRALGLDVDWQLILGDKDFFAVTKGFHNALQGAQFDLTPAVGKEYLENNRRSAEMLEDDYDVYFVHDPQPAALRHFRRNSKAKWIWRCHIDSSQPNPAVWEFLRRYIQEYDAAVFTMEEFRPAGLELGRIAFIPPAIDPFATKNMDIPQELCRKAVADSGVNLRAPLLLQVSRFDPWKDPLGVIRSYRLVKQRIPGVQLALVGALAGDDPEGWQILEKVNAEALKDPDLHIFTNLTGVGNMEVNIFQRAANVVIQKSLKEGFGLVVSEALWKEKPLVAGAAGGIPMQFPEGYEKYLVGSPEECAERVVSLLENPEQAFAFGRAGKKKVQEQFLLPRLIRDELRLIRDVLANSSLPGSRTAGQAVDRSFGKH